MNKRQSIPFIVLFIACAVWVYFSTDTEYPALPDHHPSYIADDLQSNHYDQTGFNDYRVFADKATNFPEDDTTLFEHPKVVIYHKDKETSVVSIWQLTSIKGTLKEKSNLLLSGNVLIKNITEDQMVQTMSTAQATIMLDTKVITSDLKVTWTGPQLKHEGVGMWASIEAEEMKLNSNIKAVYFNEPK